MTGPVSATPSTPAIYELSIERYRGIPSLQWRPVRGVNVILGGGDVGKTTILEAIALLLSPVNPANLSDPDYHDRKIDAGFSIEAILSLPLASGINNQLRPSWPWEWTEAGISVPSLEDDGKMAGEPLYRVRVRGTEDLEAACSVFADRTRGSAQRVEIRTIDSLIVHVATAYHAGLSLPADVATWARRTANGYAHVGLKVAGLLRRHPMIASTLARRFPTVICDEHQRL
jgi:hypothetical protein